MYLQTETKHGLDGNMKQYLKDRLKTIGAYYFLQGHYRLFLSEFERLKNKIQYSKFRGSGYTCNICGASYRKFIPHYPTEENKNAIIANNVIAGFGENIYCPSCASSARQRLVVAALDTHVKLNGKKILHLSPEKYVFNFLKKRANVTTADIEPGFYKIIDSKIIFADATQLPFGDEEFDIVIANHVLEHIPNDYKAMKEFYRVLKKNGVAILQVPYSLTIPATIEQPDINDPELQQKLFGQKDHVRIYELGNYIARLQQTGFKVTIMTPVELSLNKSYIFQQGESFLSIVK